MSSGSRLGLVVVAALCALVLGVVVVGPRSNRPPAPKSVLAPARADEHAELAGVKRELSLMRAELAGLKEQLNRPVEAPQITAEQAAPPPEPAKASPVTPEAAQVHFERTLAAEAVDVNWARGEEQSIIDFVKAEAGDGASLETVTCRSSMCRLTLRFKDDRGRDAFKLKLGAPPLDNGGFYKEDGETGLAFYAARKGYPLPAVPSED